LPATSPPPATDSASRTFPSALALAALVGLAFLPLWSGGFIWDDDINITLNPHVQGGFDGLLRLWGSDNPDYYPLTWSLFWIEWHLWGPWSGGFHLVNLALHALGAILVWRVLERLEVRGAWLGAALFAVQPVNVASAGWITEGKNTLSLVFAAAATLLYLGEARYGWSLLLFALALLSKSSVVTLPIVLAALSWWKERPIAPRRLAPFLALSLAATVAALWFHEHRVLFGENVHPEGPLQRVEEAGAAFWFYLRTELFPLDLPIVYPRWSISGPLWALPAIAAVALAMGLWARRAVLGRGPFAALVCYLAFIAPVAGFFTIGYMKYSLVADHWQYLASIVTMAGLAALLSRLPRPVGGAVLAVLAVLTFRQAAVYASAETLWRTALARNPEAWAAWLNLGQQAELAGRVDEAMEDYERCIRLHREAVIAHNNLAALLRHQGRLDEAIAHLEYALALREDYPAAHLNLGATLQMEGRIDAALVHFRRALALQPDSLELRVTLSGALILAGRPIEAQREAEIGLERAPHDPALLFNLGLSLERQGKRREALMRYAEALQVKPDLLQAVVHSAWIMATAPEDDLRNPADALTLATHAAEVTGRQDPDALDALAAALADQGRFEEAVETARAALEKAPPETRSEIQKRVNLYNAMLPFRAPR
jgi:tetratricopeptide (TPR) repeat protein